MANNKTNDALLKPGGIIFWDDNEIQTRGKAVKQPERWLEINMEDEGPTVLAEHLQTVRVRHT